MIWKVYSIVFAIGPKFFIPVDHRYKKKIFVSLYLLWNINLGLVNNLEQTQNNSPPTFKNANKDLIKEQILFKQFLT